MERITVNMSYLDYTQDERDPDAIEIRTISVHPYERREGIGTMLLEKVKEIAKGRIITAYSDTDPEKEAFGKFLVKNGFVKTKGQNNYGACWELTNYYVCKKPRRMAGDRRPKVGRVLGNKKPPAQRRSSKRT